MILSTHALIGAAIGSKIEDPFIIIVLALITHYVVDSFRHGEYFDDRKDNVRSVWWKITLDLFLGLTIIFSFLYFNHANQKMILNILIGTFFSMFPDFFTVLFYWRKNSPILIKIKEFGSFMHRYSKFPRYAKERQWTLRNYANDFFLSVLAIIILFI